MYTGRMYAINVYSLAFHTFTILEEIGLKPYLYISIKCLYFNIYENSASNHMLRTITRQKALKNQFLPTRFVLGAVSSVRDSPDSFDHIIL